MSQLFGMNNIVSSLSGKYENKTNKETLKTENTKTTIGNPKLSDSASSYYEELKAKYSDVEFVLVDNDNLEAAKQYTSNLVTDKSMIVLISEDEVEKMASDTTVRAQNESLIDEAKAQMPDLLKQLKETGAEVKSFGMEFNKDGTISYFAVVDKSLAAQKERIEENLAEKRAEKKENKKENLTTVTASNMEDLIQKIKDTMYEAKADSVRTEQEKQVGQHFDFSL